MQYSHSLADRIMGIYKLVTIIIVTYKPINKRLPHPHTPLYNVRGDTLHKTTLFKVTYLPTYRDSDSNHPGQFKTGNRAQTT